MKMPTGWKDLKEYGTPRCEHAAEMIKEMAECLEDVCLNKDETKINWNRANRVLSEFKEWEFPE